MTQSGRERLKRKTCGFPQANEGMVNMALLLTVGKKKNPTLFLYRRLWSITFQTAADVCLSSCVVYAAHNVQEDTREKLPQRPLSKKTYAVCTCVRVCVLRGLTLHSCILEVHYYLPLCSNVWEVSGVPSAPITERIKAVGVAALSPWNCLWNPFTETGDWGLKKSGASERCKNKICRHVNVSVLVGREGGSSEGDDNKEIIERKW